LNYNLWHLFGPVSWPAWAWIAACLTGWTGHPQLSRRFWFWGGLWALVMIATPLGHLVIRPLESQFKVPKSLPQIDGILMLTGSERLKLSTYYRQPVLSDAGDRELMSIILSHKFPKAELVVVGGVRDGGSLRDTDIAYSAFINAGLAKTRLKVINGTRDTCANAAAAKTVMRPGMHWLLVTSAAHMPRAMACFTAADLQPIPYPVDFRGRSDVWHPIFMPGGVDNLATFDFASHEWVGLVYYRLRGKTATIFPKTKR
jgi:uncharacterized SAM-binding protein YcdF (DUF218 family)